MSLHEQVTTATFAKVALLFGSFTTALAFLASNVSVEELPKVEPHTALDTLLVGLVSWLIRQGHVSTKKHESPSTQTGSMIMEKLETLGGQLTEHRVEFKGFSEGIEAQVVDLKRRVTRTEERFDSHLTRRDSGEIRR